MGYQVYYSHFQPVIGFVEHKEKGWGRREVIPHFFLYFFFLPFYGWWHLGALVRRLILRTYLFFKLKCGWLTSGLSCCWLDCICWPCVYESTRKSICPQPGLLVGGVSGTDGGVEGCDKLRSLRAGSPERQHWGHTPRATAMGPRR